MFLFDPNITKIICKFYKVDLNIKKIKLYRDMFHNILKGRDFILSLFANTFNISKNKLHLVIHLNKLMNCM